MDSDNSNLENFDGDVFLSPGAKAAIIIAVAAVVIFIAFCIMNGCPCCSWGSKAKNYHLNMERIENGCSESEKEPSAPDADSDRFYHKNLKEFNDK